MGTSMTINRNFCADSHRDEQNIGSSFLKAFGCFKGADSWFWPSDDGPGNPKLLSRRDAIKIDVQKHFVVFEGQKTHAVTRMTSGERFSVVSWVHQDVFSLRDSQK